MDETERRSRTEVVREAKQKGEGKGLSDQKFPIQTSKAFVINLFG
jgi:hypothetical protein